MAKVVIPRIPGESDADYKRRSSRERQRIYRQDNVRVGRGRKPGQQNAKPDPRCLWSSEDWQWVRSQAGEPAHPEYRQRYRKAAGVMYAKYNRDQIAAKAKERRPKTRERDRATARVWAMSNPDAVRAQQKRYLEKNREARLAALKAWQVANVDRLREVHRNWWRNNRDKQRAYAGKWRRAARRQTPPWADFDKILAVYEEAVRVSEATGVPHHVDHIIPLQGKTVSGLHVETNLRVITATENVKKRNKLIPELAEAS